MIDSIMDRAPPGSVPLCDGQLLAVGLGALRPVARRSESLPAARVEAALGIDQERAGGRHLLAGDEALKHGEAVAGCVGRERPRAPRRRRARLST